MSEKMTTTRTRRPAWWYSVPLATAILWAAVMVATAIVLMGTDYFGQLLPILGGAAIVHLVIVGAFSRPDDGPAE